ncbi:uncharacterized protein LOC133415764 isoform X4 [Phycodurus eques]|uniref:uncharacterized protein LOC133415764 isoform X4 n=1 Tax=Phycodurus eques TaxID=693459 RepID=UPI002ACD3D74|nr:uncharacterized protein LOC133415764 isoform X4 [Phycodurus eques]
MNLFCFTLQDGSSESIYEPPNGSSLKDVLPKYHCSPLLRQRPQWTGSDPNLSYVQTPNNLRLKRNNRRSCIPVSAIENQTSVSSLPETDYTCWTASGLRKDTHHQETELNIVSKLVPSLPGFTGMSEAACHGNTEEQMEELNTGKTKNGPRVQSRKGVDENDGAMTSTARRLKMLHDFVQAKKGHQSFSGKGKNQPNNCNVLSNSNPVLTCIGLGKRTEKTTSRTEQQLQHEEVKNFNEDSKREGVWSPIDCSQPCSPFYHTCRQPGHELWVCGGNLLLPRATEWDRFESLIQELDRKESDLPPTTITDSATYIQSAEDKLTNFGKSGTPTELSPFMRPQHNTSSLLEQSGSKPRQRETEDSPQADTKPIETTAEKKCADNQNREAKKRESGVMRILTEGRKLSSTSMESLYSLNSRQSSSSGVTSDCSSNRGSLRLEDDVFCTRHFCGRARVHTEFMPSPYDTESLKLKVGDVIDIIHKRPVGIWTGMLNNKVGNFKFVYVDELTEACPETCKEVQNHRASQKCRSTVHEVLRRLSLEEYSSSLQQNGYQTVDDLMRLRDHHLTKLKVTDPEHRRRLLAAVEALQQLGSNCHLEKEPNQEAETPSENTNNCPRDSGCHMPSDSTDITGEDTDLHFPYQPPQPKMMAS